MKKPTRNRLLAVTLTASYALIGAVVTPGQAQVTFEQVTNGLVDFYPLDYLNADGRTTPDLISRRDLILSDAVSSNNLVASTHSGGAVTNCFNLNQSGGPTVLYYNSTGQDPLTGEGDFLPFCNQRGATMNFWIKGNQLGTDTRFFGEADTTGGQANPLYLWGDHSSAPGRAHLLFRQQDASGPANSTVLDDGTYQILGGNNIGYYMEQGGTYTSNSVLDGTWHMFTVTVDTNGNGEVYVDGVRDEGIGTWTDLDGNPSALRPVPVTNLYYTTNIYPAAGVSNPPPRGYVGWVLNGIYDHGSTVFGGFKRGGISSGVPCEIDDIGFWDRVLDSNEIAFVMTNGLPGLTLNTNKITINSFAADLSEVGVGDTVGLSWNVTGASTAAGGLVISGVGDVTDIGPIGSTNVPLTANQTYSFMLTAHNGVVQDQTASVSVKTFPGVSSDWHLIQRFDGLFSDTTQGIDGNGWHSALSDYQGNKDRWNVITLTNAGGMDKVLAPKSGYFTNDATALGFDTRGSMAYGLLNGLTMPPGQSSTLFFRFALKEPPPDPNTTLISDMDCAIGMSDFNFVGPVSGAAGSGNYGNIGPFLSIIRDSGGFFDGGPIDLVAQDYGGTGVTNSYHYTNSVPEGLETNVNYLVWMDIQNNNTHMEVIGGVSNTVDEAVYSVWLQKQGDPDRTLLFSGFHGNRDYVGFDPVVDSPEPYLNKVFCSIADEDISGATGISPAGAYFATNMIAVDDFYLSKSGFSSTIPKLFDIRAISRSGSDVTIVWDSLGSIYQTNTYTIQRTFDLVNPTWTTLVSGYPSGGDSTSYTDSTLAPSDDTAYYRIIWP